MHPPVVTGRVSLPPEQLPVAVSKGWGVPTFLPPAPLARNGPAITRLTRHRNYTLSRRGQQWSPCADEYCEETPRSQYGRPRSLISLKPVFRIAFHPRPERLGTSLSPASIRRHCRQPRSSFSC